jgi:hypothetical protein
LLVEFVKIAVDMFITREQPRMSIKK